MEKKILHIPADGVTLYAEQRGQGPLLVVMPDGTNDCEPYAKLCELMADEYTVVTFDPRGGSRSMPQVDQKVTAEILAEDLAAIIRYMDMGKASVFGVSSGGQGALMLGVLYPELVKNVMVHEAALMMDGQLPGVTFDFFQTINQTYAARCSGFLPHEMSLYVGICPADAFAPEVVERINANNAYWMQYYFGVQDSHSYTKEELARIPHADWTVGCWTPSWHTYGNIETAKRGGFPYTWLPSAHTPHLTCPELLARQLKKTIKKYE